MEFTPIVSAAASSASGGGVEEVDGSYSAAGAAAETVVVEKEHMFDKVVTPSDVGKLNRLVIPKQHAEKFFPLDASSTDKGLLLSFEDRTGKPWRFRYSYWNSSQSYVMTKGWSRFVKEKRLDAGDTVSFGRGVGSDAARGRLFIDWRRRPDVVAALAHPHYGGGHRLGPLIPSIPFAPWTTTTSPHQYHHHHAVAGGRFLHGQMPPSSTTSFYDHQYHHHRRGHVGYDVGYGAPATGQVLFYRPQQLQHPAVVLESVPVRIAAGGHPEPSLALAPSKRVRLFGVNLDCADSEEDPGAIGRSAAPTAMQQLPSTPSSSSSSSGKARCSLNLDL